MNTSDKIQIAIAIITLIGIIISVFIALLSIRQNNKMLEENSRAHILLYVDFSPSYQRYYIIIKNFGNSLGKVYYIKTNPKLKWNKSKFKQNRKAITESKNFILAPNQKISSWFEFNEYPDKEFDVELCYESLGKKYIAKYTINLSFIKNIDWLTQYAFDDATKDYKKSIYALNNSIQDLSDKFR